MLTSQEGEGWQQLGEGLMPTSAKSADFMIDGFGKIGDQALHSAFGSASVPDLKDALGAMFGPEHLNPGVNQLPNIDLFDSSAAGGSSPLRGVEAAAPTAAPGSGFESAGLQPGAQAAPAPGFESAGLQPGAQAAPAPGLESAGLQAGVQAAPAPGFESAGLQAGVQGPGTIETLHAPGMDQALANVNAPGVDSFKLQTPGAGAESAASLSGDATSPLANMGKAFTDVMSKMGDMLGTMAQGPMGFLGGMLNFLLTMFSEMLTQIGTAVEETAKAAASTAADLWKKQLGSTT